MRRNKKQKEKKTTKFDGRVALNCRFSINFTLQYFEFVSRFRNMYLNVIKRCRSIVQCDACNQAQCQRHIKSDLLFFRV